MKKFFICSIFLLLILFLVSCSKSESSIKVNDYFNVVLMNNNLPEKILEKGTYDTNAQSKDLEIVQTMWYGKSVGLIVNVFFDMDIKMPKDTNYVNLQNVKLLVENKVCTGPFKGECVNINQQANICTFVMFFYTDLIPNKYDSINLKIENIQFFDEESLFYDVARNKEVVWTAEKTGTSISYKNENNVISFVDLSPFILHVEKNQEFNYSSIFLVKDNGEEIPIKRAGTESSEGEKIKSTCFLNEFVDISNIKGIKINEIYYPLR